MSEAEKKANYEAVAELYTDATVMVDGIVTAHAEKLTEDGAKDVVRALKAIGWMPSRESAGAVRESDFVDRLTGIIVTIDAKFWADRPLNRGGAQSLWDRAERAKWFFVRAPE
jgi:hypothetical protein